MEFEIKYEDYFENEIDFNSINSNEKYLKVYYKNGFIKKKEEYLNDKITHLIYYLDETENIKDVLKENVDISSVEIIELQKIGEYLKRTHRDYHSGIKDEHNSISVIDSYNREIYYNSIIGGEEETNKYFYNKNGKKIYTFWYYKKGTVGHIDTLNPKHFDYLNDFKQSFTAEEFMNLPDVDWKNMKYYHHAEPIIPE
ncbi:MAG: hypothetical protein LBE92_17040 [Chryseobacterium sp.]|jgi:ribosomal protein S8|uniref:hypothetical protein n=1 Tax=Chryseobacterium sp. TaxID=1871047 RepID=UPI002838D3CB|nr:hypothetical protein [Chryseobacterium sp.]MDR2237831.1 hypothetical protein [Chryseobacterium sp.]